MGKKSCGEGTGLGSQCGELVILRIGVLKVCGLTCPWMCQRIAGIADERCWRIESRKKGRCSLGFNNSI